jgi:rod shape determining protein RodA
MFERRLSHHLDWLLLSATLVLSIIGVAMIYSITGGVTGNSQLYITQLYAIVLGCVALMICLVIDYRTLLDKSHLIYLVIVGLLVYVLLFGSTSKGAQRWISLGAFNLQPSEFAKIAVALGLAKFFGENRRGAPNMGDLLVARQPDLGTAVTLLPIFAGVAFVAGMRLRILGIALIVAIVAAPIVWQWGLRDYQKSRISTFFDPAQDPKGSGYQQIQAQVTVGSGGLWGKGFTKGTQGQFRFLPEAQTDFVFSVLAEEQGFAGVLVALGLYLFIIVRSIEAARLAKDRLGAYLVIGLLSGITFQVIYNVTMSVGLAPVKGLPLPLMSYGGSSMIATLASIGLILNVRMRRFTN